MGSFLPYGSEPSRWGHPCGVVAGVVLDQNEGLVWFLFTLLVNSSRWGHPLGRACFRSHSRSEQRIFCFSFGWFRPFAVASPLEGRVCCGLPLSIVTGASFLFYIPSSLGMRSPCGSSVVVGSNLIAEEGFPWWFALDPSIRAWCLCLRFLFAPCRWRRGSWWSSLRPRLGVLQAFSGVAPFVGSAACIFYVPQFGAQSESLTHSIPRSFLVVSLSDFAEGLAVDFSLCPACALRISLNRSCLSIPFALSPLSRRVFDGGIHPLRVVTLAAGASHHAVGSVGAHGIRGGSAYIALHRSWSVSAVLASATWGSGWCFILLPARLSAFIHWR